MTDVTELRVALTVQDFGQALAFCRDALGLGQLADWSSGAGRVVVLDAGRATLELLDHAQAKTVDAIEAGRRVSGTVRLAPHHLHGHRAPARYPGAPRPAVLPEDGVYLRQPPGQDEVPAI